MTVIAGEKFPGKEHYAYITAKRYGVTHRLLHWVNMFSMMIFFTTGFEIHYSNFPLGGHNFTQDLHVFLGIFIILWSVFLYIIYHIVEGKLHEIIPTPRDFLDMAIIMGCALRILPDSKYPHYDFYDPVLQVYVMKYHPTQKLLAFGNFVMLIFMGFTGFALYENLQPGKLGVIGTGSKAIVNPVIDFVGIQLRFLHFFIFLYFFVGTSIHVYFTLLPSNRRRLKGMIGGYENIPTSRIYIEDFQDNSPIDSEDIPDNTPVKSENIPINTPIHSENVPVNSPIHSENIE